MELEQVNKILAEACGVEFITKREGFHWYFQDDMPETEAIRWTIEDVRCREVVEAKYGICTIIDFDVSGWSVECFTIGYQFQPRDCQECYLYHDGMKKKHRTILALPVRFETKHLAQNRIACMIKIAENIVANKGLDEAVEINQKTGQYDER